VDDALAASPKPGKFQMAINDALTDIAAGPAKIRTDRSLPGATGDP